MQKFFLPAYIHTAQQTSPTSMEISSSPTIFPSFILLNVSFT